MKEFWETIVHRVKYMHMSLEKDFVILDLCAHRSLKKGIKVVFRPKNRDLLGTIVHVPLPTFYKVIAQQDYRQMMSILVDEEIKVKRFGG